MHKRRRRRGHIESQVERYLRIPHQEDRIFNWGLFIRCPALPAAALFARS
jgi:hypothetical protein